jgi:hypothetical protein
MAKTTTIEISASSNIFKNPERGFHHLMKCIFHTRASHLVDLAENLVRYIRDNGKLHESEYRKHIILQKPLKLEFNNYIYTYANYQRILRKLLAVGMIERERGYYKLSTEFSRWLNEAARTWGDFVGRVI